MQEKFTVTGMTCAACQAHVDKAVRKLSGVTEVNVNLLGGTMRVTHDETVTTQAIVDAVVKAGYGASPDVPAAAVPRPNGSTPWRGSCGT